MGCLNGQRLCKQNLPEKTKYNWVTTEQWREDSIRLSSLGLPDSTQGLSNSPTLPSTLESPHLWQDLGIRFTNDVCPLGFELINSCGTCQLMTQSETRPGIGHC